MIWKGKANVQKGGNSSFMKCRKYRACLVGVIAVALAVGIFIYMRDVREREVPVDGTLVKNCEEVENGTDIWA